jgi:hypothetical protein
MFLGGCPGVHVTSTLQLEDLRPFAALAQHMSGIIARSIASRSVSYGQYSSLSRLAHVSLC